MASRKLGLAAACMLAAGMVACAGHSKQVVPKPVVKRIALIPATNPRQYTLYNMPPPIGYPGQYWVNKADSGNKEQFLNERLSLQPLDLAGELTQVIAQGLRSRGFSVEVLENLARPADAPDNIDYDKLSINADVILHVWITEVGLYSSRTSKYYLPRVNAAGEVFVKGQDDTLYHEDICYGADARKDKAWAIMPDPKYSYRYFDDAMAHLDDVRASFEIGAHEIGKRMTEQIEEAVR